MARNNSPHLSCSLCQKSQINRHPWIFCLWWNCRGRLHPKFHRFCLVLGACGDLAERTRICLFNNVHIFCWNSHPWFRVTEAPLEIILSSSRTCIRTWPRGVRHLSHPMWTCHFSRNYDHHHSGASPKAHSCAKFGWRSEKTATVSVFYVSKNSSCLSATLHPISKADPPVQS